MSRKADRRQITAKSRGSQEDCRIPWKGNPEISCQAWRISAANELIAIQSGSYKWVHSKNKIELQ